MCHFFSFLSTPDGRKLYFDDVTRESTTKEYDSHSYIAEIFLGSTLREDQCNKYEYSNGELIVDHKSFDEPLEDIQAWIDALVASPKWERICIAAVKQEGLALEYVHEQTPDICMTAVKQDGWALKYVREQTSDICMAAVKRHGSALRYVHEQTPDICMAAVKQYGWALQCVHEQTPDICAAAVAQDPTTKQLVR